jgi:hypothetical protein
MHNPRRQPDPALSNDPLYMAHEHALIAQEFLLMNYGITHFEPETHLPIMMERPDDAGLREMCDALRHLMQEAARVSLSETFLVMSLMNSMIQLWEKFARRRMC